MVVTAPVRCPNAHPVRVDGETVIERCRGQLVPSTEGDYFICSDEGEEVTFRIAVIRSFKESALWHRAFAVSKMLSLLTRFNPRACNSSYPWIDIPLSGTDKAVVETTNGSWDVHFHREDHPFETQPTGLSTASDDTEAIAHAIARVLPSVPS